MQRRAFIGGIGLVGLGAAVATPKVALAGADGPMSSKFAGSLYYTKNSPGRWAGKEGGHVPTIERNGKTIQVTTGHEMDSYNHYIIKHILMNTKLEFVHEKMFNPERDSPISEHDISGLSNTVYVVSLCNKHDAWLNELKI